MKHSVVLHYYFLNSRRARREMVILCVVINYDVQTLTPSRHEIALVVSSSVVIKHDI